MLGGDLNFLIGVSEIWEMQAHPGPIYNFFVHKLEDSLLYDLELRKFLPTWRNKRTREDFVTKRIDIFFIHEHMMA